MRTEHELIEARRENLRLIRQAGVEPYPYRFQRTHTIEELRMCEAGLGREGAAVAGRVMALRRHGALVFADLEDGSGKMQLLFSRESLGTQAFDFLPLVDVGDFLGVHGHLTRTKAGELTLQVVSFEFLAKGLRPLPEKWHGIKDPELKYRRRSEFLLANPRQREIIGQRAKAVAAVRRFLDGRGFVEVEIPVLQPVYGGASARPFTTHVNALGQDYYLSISPELYLKRLIAGGFERVYTIGKNFRNEGIDKSHNPEFTMLECYAAYADYNDMMALTEELYAYVFLEVMGTTRAPFSDENGQPVELDFTPPWRRATMLDLVAEYAGLDAAAMSEEELRAALRAGAVRESFYSSVPREQLDEWTWGELVQVLFEHFAEPHLAQPTFVLDHPRETTPLCKIHREDPRLIERFEPFAASMELGNAYSELNDPVVQRELLEHQAAQALAGDELAHRMDEDFCRAIEVGIPPTGGLGIGIDRLVMLVTGCLTIKDVICFPLVRRDS